MIQLPENFETYAEARKAGFLRMKQLKESGRKVVPWSKKEKAKVKRKRSK